MSNQNNWNTIGTITEFNREANSVTFLMANGQSASGEYQEGMNVGDVYSFDIYKTNNNEFSYVSTDFFARNMKIIQLGPNTSDRMSRIEYRLQYLESLLKDGGN